ncbi:hypothetical protein ACQ4WY_18890 [Janthinobacterium sp. LB2P49]|uniref:hypothetical protein n=1 Tax=Janthinobacterium sp. LB2P49 TaxID=3424198 RepID=UPI003F224EA5
MSSIFKFEAKFGWAEAIAALAFLSSIGSFLYARDQVIQNLPDLHFESESALRIDLEGVRSKKEILVMLPIIVTNRGGRTATLVKIEKDTLPQLLEIINDKIQVKNNLTSQYSFTEGKTNNRSQLSTLLSASEFKPFILPQIINESVESGKSRTFVLLLKIRREDESDIGDAKVLFSAKAVFSDGSTFKISRGFGFPQTD